MSSPADNYFTAQTKPFAVKDTALDSIVLVSNDTRRELFGGEAYSLIAMEGGLLRTSGGADFDMTYNGTTIGLTGGIAYVGGRRFAIANQDITVGASEKVYIDSSGTIQVAGSYPSVHHAKLCGTNATPNVDEDGRLFLNSTLPSGSITGNVESTLTLLHYVGQDTDSDFIGKGITHYVFSHQHEDVPIVGHLEITQVGSYITTSTTGRALLLDHATTAASEESLKIDYGGSTNGNMLYITAGATATVGASDIFLQYLDVDTNVTTGTNTIFGSTILTGESQYHIPFQVLNADQSSGQMFWIGNSSGGDGEFNIGHDTYSSETNSNKIVHRLLDSGGANPVSYAVYADRLDTDTTDYKLVWNNGSDRMTLDEGGNLNVVTGSLSITSGGATLGGNLTLAANSITGTSVDIDNVELQQLSNIATTTISADQWGILGGLSATLTAAELNYCEGVGSAIQTQLDTKVEADRHVTYILDLNNEIEDYAGTPTLTNYGGTEAGVTTWTSAGPPTTMAFRSNQNFIAPELSTKLDMSVLIANNTNVTFYTSLNGAGKVQLGSTQAFGGRVSTTASLTVSDTDKIRVFVEFQCSSTPGLFTGWTMVWS